MLWVPLLSVLPAGFGASAGEGSTVTPCSTVFLLRPHRFVMPVMHSGLRQCQLMTMLPVGWLVFPLVVLLAADLLYRCVLVGMQHLCAAGNRITQWLGVSWGIWESSVELRQFGSF